MGLFGKKKKEDPENEELIEETEVIEDDSFEEDAEIEEEAEIEEIDDEEAVGEEDEEPQVELSPEDKFRERCSRLSRAIRMMFPQQMHTGFYYAELQEEGYIDDFCCYTTNEELLERDDIPKRCGMSDPEMIAREEKLEQAFFLFRRAAIEYTQKPCNGVTVTLFSNGQAKLDVITDDLSESTEDERYAAFREIVEKHDPTYLPPRIPQEQLDAIRAKSDDIYREMGQSFYNFIPGNEFRVAYFYAEFSDRGVFYFYRCVANNGTILDEEKMFEHFHVDIEETEERRNEVIKNMLDFRQVFIDEGARAFSAITLSITGDGKFNTALGYGPTDEKNEHERLEVWKGQNTGEGFPPVKNRSQEDLLKKVAEEEVDPELQQQVNDMFMELGTEYFSYLPDTEFIRTYFLAEFSEDGIFTYQRMILEDGTTVEGDDMFEKYEMDVQQAEDDRGTIIGLIENIRNIFVNEGETPFNAMTLAISDKGEFRTYMSFDPVDAESRDERLEAWKEQYDGEEVIG